MRSTATSCGTKPSVELGRLGPAPRRVDEGEGAVVADLPRRPRASRAKSASVSPGKPTMMSVVSAHVGHVLADQRDAVEVALARVGPAHRLQDRRRARLQRQVDVLADARQLGVRADRRPRACPSGAGSCSGCGRGRRPRRARCSSSAKRRAARRPQVAAVGVDVLAQQRDLAHAVGGEAPRLGDELVERARDLAPARARARCSSEQRQLQPTEICTHALERRARACTGRWPVKPSNSKKPCAVSESLVRNSASLWTWPGPKATSTNGNCAEDLVLDRLRPAAADADHDAPGRGA